jgi:hypothetical protein
MCNVFARSLLRDKLNEYTVTYTSSAQQYRSCVIKLNSAALVRERAIPTERPPLVGKVSANFCG